VTSSQRREFLTVLGVGVLAAGGVLFASSRVWLTLTATRPAPFSPIVLAVRGRGLYPAVFGLAVVVLISVVLIAVTAGWGRRALGVLLIVLGLSSSWYGIRGLSAPGAPRIVELLGARATGTRGFVLVDKNPLWPVLTTGLGLVIALAGVLVVVRAARWSGGLSSKYSAPAEAARSDDPWRSLDRGEDPTISDR
jgi:hypothetical protein